MVEVVYTRAHKEFDRLINLNDIFLHKIKRAKCKIDF